MLRITTIAILLLAVPALAAPHGGGGGRGGGHGGGGFGGGGFGGGVDMSDPTAPKILPQTSETQKDTAKLEKPTSEQDAQAIADAQKASADAAEKLKLKFTELQTPHFIIFTDWDAREQTALKDAAEAAYTTVAKRFEASPKDNVFVGKLPFFAISKRSDFLAYIDKIDHFDASGSTAVGYYLYKSDGSSHITMTHPNIDGAGGNQTTAEKNWNYVLTHEFTHAFVGRYRTVHSLPRWLNEGLADVIANTQFPRDKPRQVAKQIAAGDIPVSSIFNEKDMVSSRMFPVMMTMTEALMQSDSKKFMKFLNDVKDGTDAEDSLKANFNVTYVGLEEAWRKYMKTAK